MFIFSSCPAQVLGYGADVGLVYTYNHSNKMALVNTHDVGARGYGVFCKDPFEVTSEAGSRVN